MRAPTYAEATSTLALFVALGGVSWAATTLPKNSVNSAAIRDAQVRSADLAPGSVSASKLSKDLRTQLGVKTGKDGAGGTNGSNGANGTNGADGKGGAQGPAGQAGRDGAALVARTNFGNFDVASATWYKAGEMSWTQPAGALDDIRGTYSAIQGPSCNNGAGGAEYQLVVDGQEVSYDSGNVERDTSATQFDPDAQITPPWTPAQPKTDKGVFGAELPIVGGDAPQTHKLELYFKRDVQCGGAILLRDVNIFVTRFLPAS